MIRRCSEARMPSARSATTTRPSSSKQMRYAEFARACPKPCSRKITTRGLFYLSMTFARGIVPGVGTPQLFLTLSRCCPLLGVLLCPSLCCREPSRRVCRLSSCVPTERAGTSGSADSRHNHVAIFGSVSRIQVLITPRGGLTLCSVVLL